MENCLKSKIRLIRAKHCNKMWRSTVCCIIFVSLFASGKKFSRNLEVHGTVVMILRSKYVYAILEYCLLCLSSSLSKGFDIFVTSTTFHLSRALHVDMYFRFKIKKTKIKNVLSRLEPKTFRCTATYVTHTPASLLELYEYLFRLNLR